jgi:hypothetical protein
MRRALTRLTGRLRTSAGEAEDGWNRFWFTPSDPTVLGAIRVLTGLMLVYTHVVWGLQLEAFFGPDGWLSREVVETAQGDQIAWSYWWHVPAGWIWPVHIAGLLVLVAFTLGVATRATSVLAFVIVVSYVNRVPCALFGLDQINGFLTLYCAVGPSGAALSVDRLVQRYRAARQALAAGETAISLEPAPSVGANVAIRLIQIQMCVIYFFAGTSKLLGTAWWNGTAMWLAFANFEYQSTDMTWLAGHPWIVDLMTHGTVAWELTFWALIWRPFWRLLVLAGAVVTHVGIGAVLGMWTFGLIMLVGNVAFLKREEIRAALRGVFALARWKTVALDAARPESLRWASFRVALNANDPVLVASRRAAPAAAETGRALDMSPKSTMPRA